MGFFYPDMHISWGIGDVIDKEKNAGGQVREQNMVHTVPNYAYLRIVELNWCQTGPNSYLGDWLGTSSGLTYHGRCSTNFRYHSKKL